MSSFKQFLSEQFVPGRKFVGLMYDAQTQDRLRNWCLQNKFDITKDYDGNDILPEQFDFHTTVFFSNNAPSQPLADGVFANHTTFDVYPDRFELLGKEKNIPVILLQKTSILTDIKKHFAEKYGLTDPWPDYKPHISLSYNYTGGDLSELELPSFPLTIGSLKIKEVEE